MHDENMIVAAAIVDSLENPQRLLSARRKAPKSFAGSWEFPGGKVESDETVEEALVREIHEELGVEITIGNEIDNPAGGAWPVVNNWEMRVWLVEIADGEPSIGREHDQIAWLDFDEVLSVDWLGPDVPIVEAITGSHA